MTQPTDTNIDLADKLEELSKKSPAGPWFPGHLPVEDDDNPSVSLGGYDLSDNPVKSHHYEDAIGEMWGSSGEDCFANAEFVCTLVSNLPTILTALRRPERFVRTSGGMIDQHQLETVARIVESWLEWSEKTRASEGLISEDGTHIMSLPVPYWPTIAQMEVWISLFRSSAQRISDLENEIEDRKNHS